MISTDLKQYMHSLQVSSYCILALHGEVGLLHGPLINLMEL